MGINFEVARKIIEYGRNKRIIADGAPMAVKTGGRSKAEPEAQHPAMQVKCPTCGATKGALCKPVFGGWVSQERVLYSRMTFFEKKIG